MFYLPSYIVDVQVRTKKVVRIQSLCIDAVLGSFAFFQLSESVPSPPPKFATCPFVLSETDIHSKAIDEYRRHLLHIGLKMRYQFQIEKIVSCHPIYYPFWIGYFHRKGSIDFDVIDAVGGEHQGAAMRPVFMQALLHEQHRAGKNGPA
ncbi:hypothetical protein JW998_11730 [candidate division KSB1 bacterium]|nr:hypothetical protein [candidate division KSB1 bacterium]